MSGETIARRKARERRREMALASMPRRISKQSQKLWMRMTDSQRALALLIAKGGTRLTEAFRIAYKRDETDTRPTLYCQASRAAKNGKVVAMVESLIGTFDAEGLSNPAKPVALFCRNWHSFLKIRKSHLPSNYRRLFGWEKRLTWGCLAREANQTRTTRVSRMFGPHWPKLSVNCSLQRRVQQRSSMSTLRHPAPQKAPERRRTLTAKKKNSSDAKGLKATETGTVIWQNVV
jgi:hypothetical protein